MALGKQDAGSTIDVRLGSVVTVRLEENPSTGYRWAVETASGLDHIGDHFDAGTAIGGVGMRVFQFRAARVGSFELRLKNCREWEIQGPNIDLFNVKIIVK